MLNDHALVIAVAYKATLAFFEKISIFFSFISKSWHGDDIHAYPVFSGVWMVNNIEFPDV